MEIGEFVQLVAQALEVSADAHPVRVETRKVLEDGTLHVLDRDLRLWRITIGRPLFV